jgi:hypothetical protein
MKNGTCPKCGFECMASFGSTETVTNVEHKVDDANCLKRQLARTRSRLIDLVVGLCEEAEEGQEFITRKHAAVRILVALEIGAPEP